MTNDIKEKANVLQTFLNEKGYKVKHTHCIEAVSNMEHGACYNVAKDKAVRILKGSERLTFKEMQDNDFEIDVVVSVDMDILMDDIDVLNDTVSEMITGSEYALCSIGYAPYPYFFNDGGIAIRVTGYIEDIESLEHLEDYENPEDE